MTMTRNGEQQGLLGQHEASNHANGVAEPPKRSTRFKDVQKACLKAAGIWHDALDNPEGASSFELKVKPKPVTIRMHHGAVVEVHWDTAIQRIMANQAELVTE